MLFSPLCRSFWRLELPFCGAIDDDDDDTLGQAATAKMLRRWNVEPVRSEDFAESLPRHKYLLNVDGVLAAFRMATLLGAGSVVIMQESYSKEFFVNRLTPWVHYVPVRFDLSDLVSTLAILEANQTLAREIAAAGGKFAKEHIREADMYCYIWRAMRAVARLQASYADLITPAELRSQGWKTMKPEGTLQCACCGKVEGGFMDDAAAHGEGLGYCPKARL